MIDVLAQQARRDVDRPGHRLRVRILGEPREVALVRLLRARREALLERDEVGEALELESSRACVGVRHDAARARRPRTHHTMAAIAMTTAATIAATRPERVIV